MLKLISAYMIMAVSFLSYGQQTKGNQSTAVETKIIAVVNKANWCSVCKANGERFQNNIMPYTTKGVAIVINDMTDKNTIEQSKENLKKSSLYKQIYKTNRKGVGRMLQSCGLVDGKNKSMVTGIVTFIDAKTLKVVNETSIAATDAEIKTIIDNLLKA
ncbi:MULTISPECIES: hypothetical protein [Flavobacterium]|uniref:Thioredoxin family protein n=1 Tax=Flavobacterium endoglycinae TaxID=2816357 RepID=A0ABX7Q8E9_9FLAO|nr:MULTISPECIES: hypothetical protein [Flavobacterium]QSW87217.1 hypothetical protein J0383_13010 [Flavobacterium endoglycinae]